MTERIELLEEELRRIGAEIEEAATAGDAGEWIRLGMRRDALPRLIREAKAEPIREEVERLEAELEAADREMVRAREEPPPEVPAMLRGQQTPALLRNARLGGIRARQSAACRELAAARATLAEIEGGKAG